MGNYEHLRAILVSDYPTFSGHVLEKYFRLKMMESHEYINIGSWWERKKGKEANEIDFVGIKTDEKTAMIAEVKRQRRNYDHKLFMEKVEHIKSCLLMNYDIEPRLLTLEDM